MVNQLGGHFTAFFWLLRGHLSMFLGSQEALWGIFWLKRGNFGGLFLLPRRHFIVVWLPIQHFSTSSTPMRDLYWIVLAPSWPVSHDNQPKGQMKVVHQPGGHFTAFFWLQRGHCNEGLPKGHFNASLAPNKALWCVFLASKKSLWWVFGSQDSILVQVWLPRWHFRASLTPKMALWWVFCSQKGTLLCFLACKKALHCVIWNPSGHFDVFSLPRLHLKVYFCSK